MFVICTQLSTQYLVGKQIYEIHRIHDSDSLNIYIFSHIVKSKTNLLQNDKVQIYVYLGTKRVFRKYNRLDRKDINGVRSAPQGIARCVPVTCHYGRLEISCLLITTVILIKKVKGSRFLLEGKQNDLLFF